MQPEVFVSVRNAALTLLVIICCTAHHSLMAMAESTWQNQGEVTGNTISYVDVSLDGSQKYVLRVDGKPYYMTNIQIRIDNMRYYPGWNSKHTEAVVARAASDGFNTVSIPVHWREVEPEKDKFDWTILDEYLGLMNKFNIKMEMLWFGANSGGCTQRLGQSGHLRVPDYVLYSPVAPALAGYSTYASKGRNTETTSEYSIRRNVSDYSLDLADNQLKERETFVLGTVMSHIASWDATNGSRHPLIGVQIGNEVIGYGGHPFPNSLVISYLSDVAGAIKNSDYVVWTRVNCVFWDIPARIIENESRRISPQGTNIDFVGIDTYRHHFETDGQFVTSMRTNLPYAGKNYRMIMETNSGIVNAAQLPLAALSGNNAFNFYDFNGLYNTNEVKPNVAYIDDIRLVNRILNSDMVDIATNAQGYGLFVHNWEGVKSSASISPHGISFRPGYPTSQGISIIRSNNEIVLMSTKGGRFTLPDTMEITAGSQGYFDRNNEWINQGGIPLKNTNRKNDYYRGGRSFLVDAGTTVRLIRPGFGEADPKVLQAEFALLGGGAEIKAEIENIGFAGNGYIGLPSTGGATIDWLNVDGLSGGTRTIRIRYSHGGSKPTKLMLDINGMLQYIFLQPTGSWETYKFFTIATPLNKGSHNTIRLETTDNTTRINRAVYYKKAGNIDELQIF